MPSSQKTTKKMPFWEESLPLPESNFPTKTVKKTEEQPALTKEEKPSAKKNGQKPSFSFLTKILSLRVVFIFLILIILVVGGIVVTPFLIKEIKEKTQVPSELDTTTSELENIVFKRISSGFVPTIPSTKPADISVNWTEVTNEEFNFSFFHPEEWQVVKNNSEQIYTLYYPVVDENDLNLGKTVLAKISVVRLTEFNQNDLQSFLQARYNLPNASFEKEIEGGQTIYRLTSDKISVVGKILNNNLFIIEGKVGREEDFGIFFPVFAAVGNSLQIL